MVSMLALELPISKEELERIFAEKVKESIGEITEEIKKLREQVEIAGMNWYNFPKAVNWDIETIKLPRAPLVLSPNQKYLLKTTKDLASPRGWIWAATLTANSKYAGFIIRYKGPKGRVVEFDYSLEDLYLQGLVTPVPGAWCVTRWNEPTAPEYAGALFPSFALPYQPDGTFYVQNKSSTDNVTIYYFVATLYEIF